MTHCAKLFNLSPYEVSFMRKVLCYFIKRDIKVTFLKSVIFIHLREDQEYQAIFNLLHGFDTRDKLYLSKRHKKWFSQFI